MKFIVVVFAFLMLLSACDKTVKDDRDPVMEMIALNGNNFQPNDVVELNLSVSDNENLNQVRVRIAPAFAKSFGDWKAIQIREISGQAYSGSFSFVIPDTARSGYYQISAQAADLKGNGTKDSTLYFSIHQPGFAPEIHDFQTVPPIVADVIYMNGQDSLHFMGMLTDDQQLKQITFELRSTTGSRIRLLTHNIPDTLTSWDLALNTDTIFPPFEVPFPGSLLVKVLDNDGNQTRLEIPVEYTP